MKKLLATVLALTLTFGTFAMPGAERDLTLSNFSIVAYAMQRNVMTMDTFTAIFVIIMMLEMC